MAWDQKASCTSVGALGLRIIDLAPIPRALGAIDVDDSVAAITNSL